MNVNAGAAVKPEQLETTLSDMLIQWYETEEKKFFEAIDDSAEKCNEAAKSYLSKGHGVLTGEYLHTQILLTRFTLFKQKWESRERQQKKQVQRSKVRSIRQRRRGQIS